MPDDYVVGEIDVILYDQNGNPISSNLDNSIRRLETRSTIVGQVAKTGAEQKVTTIADASNPSTQHRLQTEALLAPGSKINIGSSIPADPATLFIDYLKNGANSSFLVDGSTTPVVFSYTPASGIVSVYDVLIVFTADDMNFDGTSFGPLGALTNGIKVETVLNSVTTHIITIQKNEDFLRIPGRIPLVNNTGPKDVMVVAFQFGGLVKLDQSLGDKVQMTVQDNMVNTKLKYLTSTIFATED